MSMCLTKHHTMKNYLMLNKTSRHEDEGGSGFIAPRILNLVTRYW
jgi:hypothetical protein